MCGIFGHVGDGKEDNTYALGFYCESRGTDAGGLIWSNPRRQKLSTAKRPGAVTDAVIPQYPMALDSKLVIGHTRMATSGSAKNNINNHPHVGERFLLVHNGHVWNDHEFKCKTYCDSEAIVHALEQTPAGEASTLGCIDYALTNLSGMTTVAMVDRTDPSAVWLWKDDGNPLWTMRLGNAIYFASEQWMLQELGDGEMIELRDYHSARLDSESVKGKMIPMIGRHKYDYYTEFWEGGRFRNTHPSLSGSGAYTWDEETSSYKRGNPRLTSGFTRLSDETLRLPSYKDYVTEHLMSHFDTKGCLDWKCAICHDAFGNQWTYAAAPIMTKGVEIHNRASCPICMPGNDEEEDDMCGTYDCG